MKMPTMYVTLSTVSAVAKPALSMRYPVTSTQNGWEMKAQQEVHAKGRIAVFVGGRIGDDGLRLGTTRRGEGTVEQEADEQHHFTRPEMGDPQGAYAGERQRNLQHARAAQLDRTANRR